MDERIVEKGRASWAHDCPDINAAVRDICNVHDMDLTEIQWFIIGNILQVINEIHIDHGTVLKYLGGKFKSVRLLFPYFT